MGAPVDDVVRGDEAVLIESGECAAPVSPNRPAEHEAPQRSRTGDPFEGCEATQM